MRVVFFTSVAPSDRAPLRLVLPFRRRNAILCVLFASIAVSIAYLIVGLA